GVNRHAMLRPAVGRERFFESLDFFAEDELAAFQDGQDRGVHLRLDAPVLRFEVQVGDHGLRNSPAGFYRPAVFLERSRGGLEYRNDLQTGYAVGERGSALFDAVEKMGRLVTQGLGRLDLR